MGNITYKDCKILLKDSAKPELSIDGESIQVSKDVEADSYNSGELPYQAFGSVKEIAEVVVDQRLASQ